MLERENRPSPIGVFGDGLVLVCALWGLTASFLSLYGAPAALPAPLDWAAGRMDQFLLWAALFALLSLAAWTPRRFQWTAGGLAALWGVLALTNRETLRQGAGIAVREISALFASRVDWGAVFVYESGLNSLEERAALRLFLIAALAGLALLLGWAVVRSRRWWAAVLFTLPPLLPGLLADLYPSWPPFLALCACWCAMLLCSLCRWAAPTPRGRLTLVSLSASALLLAGITLAFPREDYTRPDWARRAEQDLTNFANRMADWLPRWEDSPFHSTVTFVGAAEEADLAHAGPLGYTGRTVLRVKSDYEGRLYLRGTSLAVYEDGVWKALPEGAYEEYSPQGRPRSVPLYFPAWAVDDGRRVYTATVDNVGAVGACVYAPYHITPAGEDAEESGMLPVEDAYFARKRGQWSHTMSFVEIGRYGDLDSLIRKAAVDGFFGDAMMDGPDGAAAAQGGGAALDELVAARRRVDMDQYGQFVRAHYLDVPEELRPALEQLLEDAWWQGGLGSPYMSAPDLSPQSPSEFLTYAEQLARVLNGWYEYDQSAPAAPDGVDPVLYFLTESRRGYCMHYASAAALLLRTLGIPARYVSGFTAWSMPGREVDVADRAAHAWVEIWLDGVGWYPMEVTPAAAFDQLVQPPATDPGTETLPPPDATPTPTPVPTDAPEDTPAPTQGPNVPGGPGEGDGPSPVWEALLPVLKGLAALAGLSALLWLVQFAVKRRRAEKLSDPDRNRAALYAYRCLEGLARWGGRIDPQGVELAEKAKFSPHTLTEEELAALIRLVDVERTRLAVGPAWWKRLLFRYVWGRPSPPVFGHSP